MDGHWLNWGGFTHRIIQFSHNITINTHVYDIVSVRAVLQQIDTCVALIRHMCLLDWVVGSVSICVFVGSGTCVAWIRYMCCWIGLLDLFQMCVCWIRHVCLLDRVVGSVSICVFVRSGTYVAWIRYMCCWIGLLDLFQYVCLLDQAWVALAFVVLVYVHVQWFQVLRTCWTK
jgi:hypothetical protein